MRTPCLARNRWPERGLQQESAEAIFFRIDSAVASELKLGTGLAVRMLSPLRGPSRSTRIADNICRRMTSMRNTEIPQGNSLRRFFAGLAEHVFESRLGLADPPLVDYLSGMLPRFTHSDELARVRALDG